MLVGDGTGEERRRRAEQLVLHAADGIVEQETVRLRRAQELGMRRPAALAAMSGVATVALLPIHWAMSFAAYMVAVGATVKLLGVLAAAAWRERWMERVHCWAEDIAGQMDPSGWRQRRPGGRR